MTKLTLSDVVNLQNEGSATITINGNSAATVAAIENTISRNGTSPNQMTAALDMNSNKILNAANPTSAGDVVNLNYLDTVYGAVKYSVPQTLTPAQKLQARLNIDAGSSVPVTGVLTFNGRNGIVASTAGDYTATQVTNTPAGGIAATTVQAAITELDTEKANIASPTFTGIPAAPTAAAATNTTQIATTAFVDTSFVKTPATNTANNVPQWNGANSKLLKDGLTVGTGANNLVQLNGSSQLPAVSGALLTNLPSTKPTVQKFTASGTYTAPAAMTFALAYVKGGGGSGGSGNQASNAQGGGGGEGGESWAYLTRAQITGQTVTIGAGGAAISANVNAGGNVGGSTTIGSLVGAFGGGGGAAGPAGSAGGAGGLPGTGDWGMPGATGTPGTDTSGAGTFAISSVGGGSGGRSGFTNGVANSGGGGGGGAQVAPSGAGGSGIAVIQEFYN